MENILDRLEKWRLERGLDASQGFEFDLNVQMSFFFEEIGVEYLRSKTDIEKVDAFCDSIVFAINGSNLLGFIPKYISNVNKNYRGIFDCVLSMLEFESAFDTYYSLIFSIAKDNIKNLGYDFERCMDETLKEIESRTGAFDESTGKWEKFKTDEAKALWYSADYSKCKIV